jgi:hypothetical protein
MAPTAAQIAELRRMINEPTAATYTDDMLTGFIERYPMVDELGVSPYYWTPTTTVPTQTANIDWIPTYDLNSAAADVWDEKAAALSVKYDFSADGGNYSVSKAFEQADRMARRYRSRRSMKTVKLSSVAEELTSEKPGYIGNLPEDEDL